MLRFMFPIHVYNMMEHLQKKKLQYKNYPTKPKTNFCLVCPVSHLPPQKWFQLRLVEHNNLINSTPITNERHDGLGHKHYVNLIT